MSFFKKIGKAIGNTVKVGGKVIGKVAKTAAPLAAMVPGAGALVSAGASIVGNVLDPDKQEKIIDAVENQQNIKVEKIEETILKQSPHISGDVLTAATEVMIDASLAKSPNATIDDSKSLTTVDTKSKIVQFIKKNALYIGGAIVAFFMFSNSKNSKKSKKRW